MICVAGKVGLGALCLLGRGLLRDYVSQAASFRGFPNTSSKYDQGPQVIPLKALQPGTAGNRDARALITLTSCS